MASHSSGQRRSMSSRNSLRKLSSLFNGHVLKGAAQRRREQHDLPCAVADGTALRAGASGPGRRPAASRVSSSRSLENCVNTSISRYCASSSLSEPADFFMALVCASPPTRETERPTFTAGRWPEKNSSLSRNIWPSVMEMMLVGMYAETSPAWVSTMGRAVMLPPPRAFESCAERSSSLECR